MTNLSEYLSYDPISGEFTWLKQKGRKKAGEKAGSINALGYVQIKCGPKTYLGHRLAFLFQTGAWPKATVDHIDSDRSNNRFCNLREATHGQNQQNRSAHRDNVSGLKGVTYMKRDGRYKARINVNTICINLGHYDTAEEAYEAYMNAARELHGQFAKA